MFIVWNWNSNYFLLDWWHIISAKQIKYHSYDTKCFINLTPCCLVWVTYCIVSVFEWIYAASVRSAIEASDTTHPVCWAMCSHSSPWITCHNSGCFTQNVSKNTSASFTLLYGVTKRASQSKLLLFRVAFIVHMAIVQEK